MQVIINRHRTHAAAVQSAERGSSILRSAAFWKPLYCYTSYTM